MTQNTEELRKEGGGASFWVYSSIALLAAFGYFKLKQARRKKPLNKYHSEENIEKSKIVIAIEIKDLLIKYSSKAIHGYLPLEIAKSDNRWQKFRKNLFQEGSFYKPIFPIQKIKEFIFGLKSIPKVSLYLYTSLEPQIATEIINKLGIQMCFPSSTRRFCDLQNKDDHKHAIEVDRDSRRVIIITSTDKDHHEEDEKYFLVLKPRADEWNFLKIWFKKIKNFVEQNQDLNNLHDELGQFKVNEDCQLSEVEI